MRARHHLLGATAAAIVLAATSAEAAVTLTERFGSSEFSADFEFESRGQTFAVAEGRNGDQSGSAEWEVGLGAPDTSPPTQQAQYDWQNNSATNWSLTYTSTSNNLVFDIDGGPALALNNLASDIFNDATSLWVRARGTDVNGDANDVQLNNLSLNSHNLGDLVTNNSIEFLGIAYSGLNADWTLSGTTTMAGTSQGSNPAFQIKVSNAAVVPLPAAAWLMLSGLAGVGYTAYRGRKRAGA